jgi:hypothetical protein
VEEAGRAGCESDADGHAAIVLRREIDSEPVVMRGCEAFGRSTV